MWVESTEAVHGLINHVLNLLSSVRNWGMIGTLPLLLPPAVTSHALGVFRLLIEPLQQATPSLVAPPAIKTIVH